MSTPIWGPGPGQDDDRPDPYAAPSGADGRGAGDPATGERFGGGWGAGSAPGYPQAPAPSGYEARPSWEQGTTASASGSPYGPPPGGTGPAAPTGAVPTSPYGAPTAASPYGAPVGAAPTGAPAANPYGTPPATPYGAPPAGAGYPGGGYPAGGYPGAPAGYPGGPAGYGGPWGQQPPRTEPLATASLITSLASFLVTLAAPVGLGLGIAALRRIRRSGDQGRGMAIAGVVVGGVITAFMVLLLLFAVVIPLTLNAQESRDQGSTSTETWAPSDDTDAADDTSDTTIPPYALTIALTPGQCLADVPWEYDMSDAQVVDCAATHGAEVLSTIELTAPVPVDATVADPVFNTAAWPARTRRSPCSAARSRRPGT
jgi:hypothetical protein